ncbi:MAG TPA: orotate phosphoribosyltransferase [Candidatus Nitrosotenuis sp.]|jgi:orotate phosphoribosyltransferase|nr:orotate phosphoribosyltransferase [Candidatus Nitrosotenuis sp.]
MQPHQCEFAEFLVSSQVLRLGQFRLKSGRLSPYFLNFGQVRSGASLTRLGGFFARHLAGLDFDLLFGPAYKGIPLAVATCQALWSQQGRDLPYCSLRKEAKGHGEEGRVLGQPPGDRDRIVVVDDVMTTGLTKRQALDELRQLAPTSRVVAVVVGVDRQEREADGRPAAAAFTEDTGVPLLALLTVRQLFDHLLDRPVGGQVAVDGALYARLLDYLAEVGAP